MIGVIDKSKVLFSNNSPSSSNNSGSEENHKVSFWLKKLHEQAEGLRNDKTDTNKQLKKEDKNILDNKPVKSVSRKHVQSGINAHTRDIAAKNEADRQKLSDLVKKSNRLIISISSSFPWNIFPNTINVEESRVTFKFSQFTTSQSHSVEIKDISNVFIESTLFFSTLQVVSRTYIKNDIKIGYLNKKKAEKVKKVIEGLRTFIEHNINTSNYETEELILKISEFHSTR